MKRKWLTIGIILLFIGLNVAVMGHSTQKTGTVLHDAPFITHTPDDGLYWNNRKIAEYPVPLFLHYYFKIKATFTLGMSAEGEFEKVEFYLNGVLQETFTGPGPYVYTWEVMITPFRHSPTLGIKAYPSEGDVISDTITVYRLFS